jgi:prefoldin subunit 5
MAGQRLRQERELAALELEVAGLWRVGDSQRESQEREMQAVAEVRKVIGQLAGQLEALRWENGRAHLAIAEVARANEQLRAEAPRLKERTEVLEHENRRLSEANEVVKRDIRQVSGCCPKVQKDLTNLEQELAKLKEEMRATRPKAEPLAHPADVTVPPARKPAATARTPPTCPRPPNVGPPPPKPAPVKVSPPPGPPRRAKKFPPSVKKGGRFDVPVGIIAHLTRECGGSVHDRHVVDVTCGSFEKETQGANPYSGPYYNSPNYAAKNAADLESSSEFISAYRNEKENILHTRNNWVCYDFKERRIVPTHYTIRTHEYHPDDAHLKSWLVETSADGQSWRVAREADNKELNGCLFAATFAIAGGGECRFIRLVQIGTNHFRNDQLAISAWEIFGSLIE